MSDGTYIKNLDIEYHPIMVLDVGKTFCAYMPASCCALDMTSNCYSQCPGTRQQDRLKGAFRVEIKDKTGNYPWLNKVYGIRPRTHIEVAAAGGLIWGGNDAQVLRNVGSGNLFSGYDSDPNYLPLSHAASTDMMCDPCFNANGPETLNPLFYSQNGNAVLHLDSPNRYKVALGLLCNVDGITTQLWENEGFNFPEGYSKPDYLLSLLFTYRPIPWQALGCDASNGGSTGAGEQFQLYYGSYPTLGGNLAAYTTVLPLLKSSCGPLRLSVVDYPVRIAHTFGITPGVIGYAPPPHTPPYSQTLQVGKIDVTVTECEVGCPGLLNDRVLYWSFNGRTPVPITANSTVRGFGDTELTPYHLGIWDTPYDSTVHPYNYYVAATPLNFPQITDGLPDPANGYVEKYYNSTTNRYYNCNNQESPPSQRVLWYIGANGGARNGSIIGYTGTFSCNPLDVSITDADGNTHRITDSFRHVVDVTGVVGYNVEFTRVLVQANSSAITEVCGDSCDPSALMSGVTPVVFGDPEGAALKNLQIQHTPILATLSNESVIVRDPNTCCNGSDKIVVDPPTVCKPTNGQSVILSVNGHNYVGSWVVTYNQPDGFAAILSVSGADGYFTVNFNVNAYGTITTGIYWVDHGNTPPGVLGPTVNCGPPIVFSAYIDGVLITVTT